MFLLKLITFGIGFHILRNNMKKSPSLHDDKILEEDISDEEKVLIRKWIKKSGKNKYGDSLKSIYPDGIPLYDKKTGTYMNYYVYIKSKYPSSPWNSGSIKKKVDK